MLKLAISPCPNDTFAFYDLIHHSQFYGQIELIMADINELNQLLLQGKVDFCKASFYAFAKQQNNYSLLSSGSALGDCGPLLISKNTKELIKDSLIAIPGEFTTANLLLSLCYPQFKNKIIIPFDKIIEAVNNNEVNAGLIIHESRFTYQEKQLNCLIDLGEWWQKKTNCLIPLGAITVNRQLPLPIVTAFNQALYFSILEAQNPNYQHRDEMLKFVKKNAQEIKGEVLQKHINTYVNNQTLQLDKAGLNSINKLLNVIEKNKLAKLSQLPLLR